jgi:transposase
MAAKVTTMSKIKQLIQLHANGVSNRQIAKQLCIDKSTVNDYVNKLPSIGMTAAELLHLDEPVLEGKFKAGTAAFTDARFEEFRTLLPYFEQELARKHVTRNLLWREYLEHHPQGYRYTQFCFHLNQQTVARKPSAILSHEAGEKLFVDFAGDRLEYLDRETGEIVKCQVFIACLPHSDYSFCMAVHSQSTDDFLYALACCLRTLGGCPKILVPDNLKAAVIKADRYEPELNRVMEDFANHYGFVVCPTRARHPKDKAKVEGQVHIIYSRVYAKLRNQRFFSIEELNRAIAEKTLEHNQTRMQRHDYSREEKFLADEKEALRPLPASDFEKKYYAELKVENNCCVYLARDKHYYSVPYEHIGEKVQIIYTRTLVKIFCRNALVATHLRTVGTGYTTQPEHLCSAHRFYRDRSPEFYIRQAEKKSEALKSLIEDIFERSNRPPELSYKTCDGLLSLARKTDPVRFEEACQIARDAGKYSYHFVRNMIENKSNEKETEQYKSLPKTENVRGKSYYKQLNINYLN